MGLFLGVDRIGTRQAPVKVEISGQLIFFESPFNFHGISVLGNLGLSNNPHYCDS